MFIRTRSFDGLIFYLGTTLPNFNVEPSMITELIAGRVRVSIHSHSQVLSEVTADDVIINDGLQHFIRVHYSDTATSRISLFIDGHHYNPTIIPSEPIIMAPRVLYLGSFPANRRCVHQE